MNSAFKDYCIAILGHVKPQATFLSVKEYRNNFGEIANFSVCFHANYLSAVRKSMEIIDKIIPSSDIEAEVIEDLLISFNYTLSGFNPLYTCNDVYEDTLDKMGRPIPGIKLHKNQDMVHLNALKIKQKTIISKGIYPNVNSSEKTILKKAIRNKTPISKWVQFKLEPGRFNELVVQNMRITG